MPTLSNFRAAIFDVDDTLLNNHPGGRKMGLHEESRLQAVRTVGKRHHIAALEHFTADDNYNAFRNAATHSLEGAVWTILQMAGEVTGDVIAYDHPLLKEICTLKDSSHEAVLRTLGEEVPGAGHFVRWLAANGCEGKLAVASTAVRRDVMISLEVIGVRELFPDECIISKDKFTHAKPHPESFQLALASLHLPSDVAPGQVLAFEDDPRGIMSAKAAGLFTCAIASRFSKKDLAALEVPPDLIADTYTEFEELFN
ncbi:MAG TPA: HAD family phosphatase [Candidatus Saccharimonadales bacterium]|nr:HAD family phosphatase [Candidatus Saccharimonadales bacterium]